MADCAAGGRTEHTVVMGEMSGYAADHRAFDTALGLGGAGGANERKYQGRRDTNCLHATLLASLPMQSAERSFCSQPHTTQDESMAGFGAGEGKPPLAPLGIDITADFPTILRCLVASFVALG